MSDYPPRVTKSENIYALWESGEGDMGELAIGLYDLTAHFKALWDDYAKLERVARAAKAYKEYPPNWERGTVQERIAIWKEYCEALGEVEHLLE